MRRRDAALGHSEPSVNGSRSPQLVPFLPILPFRLIENVSDLCGQPAVVRSGAKPFGGGVVGVADSGTAVTSLADAAVLAAFTAFSPSLRFEGLTEEVFW